MKKLLGFFLALLLATPCFAQDGTNHAVPIFGGPGFVGFREAIPGAVGTVLTSRGASLDPAFQPSSGGTSVLSFATGDCVTDDSTAIQAAINSLSATGGTVYFPPAPGGCYAIGTGTAITLPTAHPIQLLGAGRGEIESPSSSRLKAIAVIPSIIKTSTSVFSRGHRISNMTIDGNNLAAIGLQIDLVGSSTFDNLDVINNTTTNFRLGTTGLNAIENTLFNIRMDNPLTSHPPAVLPAINLDVWSTNNFISNILMVNASTANLRTRSGASFNNQFNAVHGYNYDYTSAVATAASVNNFLLEGTGDQFVNWETDGSSAANIQINGFQNIMSNGVSLYAAALTPQIGVRFANATCGNILINNAFFNSTTVNSIVQTGASANCPINNYVHNINGTTGVTLSNTFFTGINGVVSGNLTAFGSTSGNAQVVPQAVAGTPTLTLPNTSGTFAISAGATSPLSVNATTGALGFAGLTNNGILVASSATTIDSNRCNMDTNQGISCSSSTTFQPQFNITNTTSDNGNPIVRIAKTRSGGNTLNGDGLGQFVFNGFANAGSNQAAQLTASQSGASSGSNIPSRITLSTSSAAGQLNQNITLDEKGHFNFTASTPPTASACAGFALSTGSTDTAGRISYTSATTCTINFGSGFTSAPFCVVSPGQAASTHFLTTSTTQLAVTFGTAQTAFFYQCFGN